MAIVQSISTDNLPAHRRVAFWSEAVCEAFTQLEAEAHDPGRFSASLLRVDMGELTLARAISQPAIVRHTQARVRCSRERVYMLHLQAHGHSVNVQDGREAVLRAGDFTLCDSARPYALRFDAPNDMLVLRIPATWLDARMMRPADFTALRVPGDHGVGLLASQFLCSWWSICVAGVDAGASRRVIPNALDLLATALCVMRPASVDGASAANAKRLRILHYIDHHLADPDLDAHSIAEAVGVTARYVHRLLEASGETLGERILRLRLECCAERLRDASLSKWSITQIAFDLTFSDASYFTRCFKRHFGMTPGDYRHRYA